MKYIENKDGCDKISPRRLRLTGKRNSKKVTNRNYGPILTSSKLLQKVIVCEDVTLDELNI